MRELLGNLGYARRLGTEENHNALHGLEGIIDRMKNTSNIPSTGVNLVETEFEEERGWNHLGIPKQERGRFQIAKKSPWPPVGREWKREKSK
jgi:hypothetical protein